MSPEEVEQKEKDDLNIVPEVFGVKGGGGPTTKKTKDILRFSRRHDLFCSFLSSV